MNFSASAGRLAEQAIELPSWAFGKLRHAVQSVRVSPGCRATRSRKIADAAEVHRLTALAPSVALHIPWDQVDSYRCTAQARGRSRRATRHDQLEHLSGRRLQARQPRAHADAKVRTKAIDHHFACIDIMNETGSRDLKIWLADGTNYPGQDDMRARQDRLCRLAAQDLRAARSMRSALCSSTSSSSPPSITPMFRTGAPPMRTSRRWASARVVLPRHRPPRAGHQHRVHRARSCCGSGSSAHSTSTRALCRRRSHRGRRRSVPAVPDSVRGDSRRRLRQAAPT